MNRRLLTLFLLLSVMDICAAQTGDYKLEQLLAVDHAHSNQYSRLLRSEAIFLKAVWRIADLACFQRLQGQDYTITFRLARRNRPGVARSFTVKAKVAALKTTSWTRVFPEKNGHYTLSCSLKIGNGPVVHSPTPQNFSVIKPAKRQRGAKLESIRSGVLQQYRHKIERGKLLVPEDDLYFYGALDTLASNYPLPKHGRLGISVFLGRKSFSLPQQRQYIEIGFQAGAMRTNQAANLVLLLDCSGSMRYNNKFEVLKQAISDLVNYCLLPHDRLTIITFSDRARIIHSDRCGNGKGQQVVDKMSQIRPAGGTNLYDGLRQAFGYFADNYLSGAQNRIILFSDGRPYLAQKSLTNTPAVIEDLAAREARKVAENGRDVFFSVIGVGKNLNSRLMHALAEKSGGDYLFVADVEEIRQVFQVAFTKNFSVVSRDIAVNVRFLIPDICGKHWQEGSEHLKPWKTIQRNVVPLLGLNADQAKVTANSISWKIPTLLAGDKETYLIQLTFPPEIYRQYLGKEIPLVEVKVSYRDTLDHDRRQSLTFTKYIYVAPMSGNDEISEPHVKTSLAMVQTMVALTRATLLARKQPRKALRLLQKQQEQLQNILEQIPSDDLEALHQDLLRYHQTINAISGGAPPQSKRPKASAPDAAIWAGSDLVRKFSVEFRQALTQAIFDSSCAKLEEYSTKPEFQAHRGMLDQLLACRTFQEYQATLKNLRNNCREIKARQLFATLPGASYRNRPMVYLKPLSFPEFSQADSFPLVSKSLHAALTERLFDRSAYRLYGQNRPVNADYVINGVGRSFAEFIELIYCLQHSRDGILAVQRLQISKDDALKRKALLQDHIIQPYLAWRPNK